MENGKSGDDTSGVCLEDLSFAELVAKARMCETTLEQVRATKDFANSSYGELQWRLCQMWLQDISANSLLPTILDAAKVAVPGIALASAAVEIVSGLFSLFRD